MTFDIVRLLLILIGVATESDIDDYKVIIYETEPLSILETMLYDELSDNVCKMVYKDIPDCFNCKVHAFDIDLDKQIIFIRSEVVNNE